MIEKIKIVSRSGKQRIGRRITVTTEFNALPDEVWGKILEFDTLKYISRPKARFIPCSKGAFEWREGRTYHFRLFLHNFLPMGKHTIHVKKVDKASLEIFTTEHNKIVTVWNHFIKMKKVGEARTSYTDVVDLHAGILSPFIAVWTSLFYKHRQSRWQKLLMDK